ncbi:MAG: MarR family transcriptional regulator [Acidimicrobiia bacterium]|jgi:DNA-binding MarR family transcriptional regulator
MSLTRSELRAWLRIINGIQSLLDALDGQLRTEAGISHDDYRILSALYRAPRRTRRMTELAAEMSYSPSRLSHTAARLEKQGWVARSRVDDDRRGVEIGLTEEGVTKTRDASVGHLALVERLVFDIPERDQLRATVEVLDRIGKASAGPG